MADETENNTPEDETATDAGAAGARDEAVAADDATASGAGSSPEDAPSEEPAAEAAATEEPAAEEAAEAEAAAEPADAAGAPDSEAVAEAAADASSAEPAAPPASEAGEPAEAASPKERRQRERAAKFAQEPTRPKRSAEERQAERDAERTRKARIRGAYRKRSREKARAGRDGGGAEPIAPRREQHPGKQKTRQGIVVSDKASKTIVVRIDVARRHPFYEKVVRTSATLHAHDEAEDAHIGDTVVIRESRPLSRSKRWRLVEVVERAK